MYARQDLSVLFHLLVCLFIFYFHFIPDTFDETYLHWKLTYIVFIYSMVIFGEYKIPYCFLLIYVKVHSTTDFNLIPYEAVNECISLKYLKQMHVTNMPHQKQTFA